MCEKLATKLKSTTEIEILETDWEELKMTSIKLHDIDLGHFIEVKSKLGDSETFTYYRPYEPPNWFDVVEGLDTIEMPQVREEELF